MDIGIIMFKKNKTMSFLWQFIKRYRFSFFITFVLVLMLDLIDLIGANAIFRNGMDGLSSNRMNFNQAFNVFLAFTVVSSLTPFEVLFRRMFSFGFMFKLKEDIRNYLFNSLLKQSNAFFSNNFVGTLNSKINDIINNIGDFLNNCIDIISNAGAFIIAVIIFSMKNWKLAPFLIIWTITYFYINYKLSIRAKKQTEIATNIESECSGKIIDCFTNIVNIKNFCRERMEKCNVKKHTMTIIKERDKIIKTKITLDVVNFISKALFTSVMVLVSLKMYFNNIITLGELTFNISVSMQLFWWLRWALQMLSENIETYGKITQAVDTLVVEPTIKNKENATKLDIFSGKIELKGVSFKY